MSMRPAPRGENTPRGQGTGSFGEQPTPHPPAAQPVMLDEKTREGSFFYRLMDSLHGMTLRARLVIVVTALVALISIVVGSVSILALTATLTGGLDNDVIETMKRTDGGFVRSLENDPDAQPQVPVSVVGQGQGTLVAVTMPGYEGAQYISGEKYVKPTTEQVHLLSQVAATNSPVTVDLGGTLGQYRVMAREHENGAKIIVGLPLERVTSVTNKLLFVIALVTFGGIFIVVGAGTLIVRRATQPLERVAATALRVSELPLDRGAVSLSPRVPDWDTDPRTEVGAVGSAVNRMLDHMEEAISTREASERKVRNFVADASHELRTPLASIRGYSELAQRSAEQLPEDIVYSLGRIHSESQRMTTLVEELLLLARLDSGRELERSPVDLTMLLVDAVSDAHVSAPKHRWNLDLPDQPVEVLADRARMQQVIANLLSNERNHTPDGTVVTVGLTRELRNGQELAIISVRDNGPGIDPGIASTLFERFVRGDESRHRSTGSSGLGLSIVQAIVQAFCGTVRVRSEPGDTEFTVELPAIPLGNA